MLHFSQQIIKIMIFETKCGERHNLVVYKNNWKYLEKRLLGQIKIVGIQHKEYFRWKQERTAGIQKAFNW